MIYALVSVRGGGRVREAVVRVATNHGMVREKWKWFVETRTMVTGDYALVSVRIGGKVREAVVRVATNHGMVREKWKWFVETRTMVKMKPVGLCAVATRSP